MRKHFNTTGRCYPAEHYMADIHNRLVLIRQMIDQGDYFCINCARQYGKTTTLSLLKEELEDEYVVFSISFEGLGASGYETDTAFAHSFLCLLSDCLAYGEVKNVTEPLRKLITEHSMDKAGFSEIPYLHLSRLISQICSVSGRPVVLLIDETDQTGNHDAFLEFLGMLRGKYLKRRERPTLTLI